MAVSKEWSRVIAHVDLVGFATLHFRPHMLRCMTHALSDSRAASQDAFYAQVECKLHPHLVGLPLGVCQYNPFGDLSTHTPTEERQMNDSNGSLIAVSYEARRFGVKR